MQLENENVHSKPRYSQNKAILRWPIKASNHNDTLEARQRIYFMESEVTIYLIHEIQNTSFRYRINLTKLCSYLLQLLIMHLELSCFFLVY